MVASWKSSLLLSSVFVVALACEKEEKTPFVTTINARSAWAVRAGDVTARCADVADLRVCWGPEAHGTDCAKGICVRPASVPDVPAPDAMGWRCSGLLTERTCAPRGRNAGPFRCDGARCVQTHPRVPSDGEWQCIDAAGATVCLGGQAPAGVAAGAEDTAWHCAARRTLPGSKSSPQKGGETICVDLSPDFPDGVPRGWDCHYDREGVPARICERDPGVHVLSDSCSEQKPCVDGSHCVGQRCVVGEPHPSCWLDTDCASRACRFGTCRESGG